MTHRPGVNLLGSRDPREFFVCQIANPLELEHWVKHIDLATPEANWCAQCVLRSVMLALGMEAPSLEKLFEIACAMEVYLPRKIGWKGAVHRALALQTAKLTGRPAFMRDDLFVPSLARFLDVGFFCMLSVHPSIRFRTAPEPKTKGGHFVFVYGYEYDGQGELYFLLNNSAGFASENSQVGMVVSAKRLEQVSSGKGIIVHSKMRVR